MRYFQRTFLWSFALALCLTLPSFSPAQERDSPAAFAPFPLFALIAASRRGTIAWQPDWPISFPPDAYTVTGAAYSAIILETETGNYTLRRDRYGRLSDFPVSFEDAESGRRLYQVSFSGDPAAGYAGFTVTVPPAEAPETLWTAEFLEPSDDDLPLPLVCRVSGGGAWFFVALEYRGRRASETWFDGTGAALGVFNYTGLEDAASAGGEASGAAPPYLQTWTDLAPPAEGTVPEPGAAATPDIQTDPVPAEARPAVTRYFYDSFGNVTGITTPAGAYSARYRQQRPLYWNRLLPPQEGGAAPPEGAPPVPAEASTAFFSFQWDERGLLIRLSGKSEDGAFMQDSRCAYVIDGQGNWTERRETVFVRRAGYLVPAAERRITRRVEYQTEE